MTDFFKAYPQDGKPGHCSLAQVFAPSGESVATFDATEDPLVASSRASLLACALNDGLAKLREPS